jgi:hypothetical protein
MLQHPSYVRAALALAAGGALAGCSAFHGKQPEPRPEPAPRVTVVTLDVPPGHLPPPGKCRIWFPGDPPGHQPKARPCREIEREAPAGSWILYRPREDRSVVHVRVVDERRPGVVVWVRVFDIERRKLIRENKG